ncbi:GTP-binding protein 1-like [Glandiceps talaboti]
MCAAIVNNFLPNSPSQESLRSPTLEQNLFAPDDLCDVSNGDLEGLENGISLKCLLVNPDEASYEFLVSQLQRRLEDGQGETIYVVGEGDGAKSGLSKEEIEASVATLKMMAAQLDADMVLLRERTLQEGIVAEYLVRKKADEQDFYEVRVAVVGNVDAGKSTLLGVLTHGELDNGRGFARQKLFRHKHEMESGRTSSVGNDILGFDSTGQVVNKTDYHGGGIDWTKICQASSKVITFIDLAGHEKYLKTTVFGMTGHAPDFSMLMIGSNAGIVGMTKEHLGLALALSVPVFVVVTKIDMCPPNVLQETLKLLQRILKSPGCRKIPVLVNNTDDVVVTATNFSSERVCPIFQISNVTGENMDLLKMFLNLLSTRMKSAENEPAEFQIDDTYSVPGVGTVVSGTTLKGVIRLNDTLLLGPDALGQFMAIAVKSIHRKRLPVKMVKGGQTASFSLKKIKRSQIRKGMVMVSPAVQPKACWEFEGEILVLHHPTTISPRYQAMVHCGSIRQTATITSMSKDHLRTGDKAQVHFRFIKNPEYIKPDTRMVFREGRTKAVGSIHKIFPHVVATAQTLRQKSHKARHPHHGGASQAEGSQDGKPGTGKPTGRGHGRGKNRGRRNRTNYTPGTLGSQSLDSEGSSTAPAETSSAETSSGQEKEKTSASDQTAESTSNEVRQTPNLVTIPMKTEQDNPSKAAQSIPDSAS